MFKKFNLCRSFSTSKYIKQNVDKDKPVETNLESLQSIRPRNWEKYLLVYTKKYKTVAEVPERVSPATLDKAKSVARIKLANIIIVFMLLGCLGYVFIGKKRLEKGDTSVKRALEYKEKYLAGLEKEQGIQK